jgi:hypothetical protein
LKIRGGGGFWGVKKSLKNGQKTPIYRKPGLAIAEPKECRCLGAEKGALWCPSLSDDTVLPPRSLFFLGNLVIRRRGR